MFFNGKWMIPFLGLEAKFLSHPTSDHTPILLLLGIVAKSSPKPFKFNYWTTKPGFMEMLERRDPRECDV